MSTVTLTRPRHPFQGRLLQVLGSMRRHGATELLVVLPDGSRRLIPAAWTDLEQPAGADGPGEAATLGPVPDLLQLSVLVSGLCARAADGREQAARKSPCKEDDRAACPAQSAAGPGSGATPRRVVPASASGGGQGSAYPRRPDRQNSPRPGDPGK